jgi:hypothetical protein
VPYIDDINHAVEPRRTTLAIPYSNRYPIKTVEDAYMEPKKLAKRALS